MNAGDLVRWGDFMGVERISMVLHEYPELEQNSAGAAYLVRNGDGTTAVIRDSRAEVISERR